MQEILHVAVGLIRNAEGYVLIALRPEHVHSGGLWEFPGGKVEAGESVFQALRRELREELSIEVLEATPKLKLRHDYPERRVLLDVWEVDRYSGDPVGAENQPVRWVPNDELPQFEFPAANRPIVTAARLPDRYAILNIDVDAQLPWISWLDHLISERHRLIQLRAVNLGANEYRVLAERILARCRPLGIAVLLNADPLLAEELDAAGVHLSSRSLMNLTRRPLGGSRGISCACHNLQQLRHAESIGADFALLSPVLSTASHPNAPVLGWSGFQALADAANLPVFALGGMRPEHLPIAKAHGAQGIAAIQGFMDNTQANGSLVGGK